MKYKVKSTSYKISCLIVIIFFSTGTYAQISTISGVVRDKETNDLLPAVSVIVKGTKVGNSTDFDGKYTIKAKLGDTLQFLYLGKKTKEVLVTSTKIDVFLESDSESLEEVIVVGYGTVKKKEITGAVNRVKAKEIEQFIGADVATRLQGQVAGVSVSSASGEPGEAANIQIRGVTSLIGDNQPLYVVNGIPQVGDPGLSPNEIESIDILKDAASAAVYGSRGAAGVILITTKQGVEGKMKINFESNYGFQLLGQGTPLMNTEDQLFFEVDTENYFNGFGPLIDSASEWLNNDNTFDDFVLVNGADVQTYNLNMSGGAKGFSYNVSGSLFDQEGILINSNFQRFNGRIFARYDTDNWKIKTSIATTNETRRRSSVGLIGIASRFRPYFPEIDSNSDIVIVNDSDGAFTPINALAQALKREDDSSLDRTNLNLGVRRKLFNSLEFVTNIGGAFININRNIFRPRFTFFNPATQITEVDPTLSGVITSSSRTTKFSWDGGFAFKKKYGKHNIGAQAILTLEDDKVETFFASIEGITNNEIKLLSGGTINENVGSFNRRTTRVGTLFRIQYNYGGKYVFSALGRYDGSSRFGEKYRWGLFPSLSGAWNIHREKFWKPLKSIINQFKLRLSHGEVGNDAFSDYEFQATLSPFQDYAYDENDGAVDFGSAVRSYPNGDVRWERSVSDNVGVDLAFWGNKLTFTADYYNTRKSYMLFPVTLPGSSGAYYDQNVVLNVGDMTNIGLELAANYKASIGESKLTIGGTFTTNKNKITRVANNAIVYNANSTLIGGDPASAVSVIAEGYEAGAFFLHETKGTVQTQEQLDAYRQFPSRTNAEFGDLIYVDANGDGDITSEDRTYHGSGLADFEYGFNLIWKLKQFDFSMNWFGTVGSEILNGNKALTYNFQRHQDLVNQWTINNPTSNIPSFRGTSREHFNYAGTTDYWLEDGDYLRLKQVTLGYSLPKKVNDLLNLSSLRFYVSAQNPLTFTAYKGYDPEVGNVNVARRGIDNSRYPLTSIYSLGIKLSF